MIKWIVALRYRADQPAEACRRYWIEEHGPMALDLPGLIVLMRAPRLPHSTACAITRSELPLLES